MFKVNLARWDQSPDDFRILSLNAEHPRERERFLALYEIATGSFPTMIARKSGRHLQTVISWVHKHNELWPCALSYRIQIALVYYSLRLIGRCSILLFLQSEFHLNHHNQYTN